MAFPCRVSRARKGNRVRRAWSGRLGATRAASDVGSYLRAVRDHHLAHRVGGRPLQHPYRRPRADRRHSVAPRASAVPSAALTSSATSTSVSLSAETNSSLPFPGLNNARIDHIGDTSEAPDYSPIGTGSVEPSVICAFARCGDDSAYLVRSHYLSLAWSSSLHSSKAQQQQLLTTRLHMIRAS